ncbi:MAG: hypothetical protein GWN79_17045, partial [Actinobacteria bacterium]|nr:hypothetical protein [Actinomycetota bacterium]NIS33654.1 hypothetical protein [Actinomycetota bacterium]NIT97008.1 hypothetical protein [Actinomycetota bacterium]NIU20673.1 hypothetical protein [Actinomycetota bacterium]NIU68510.1 hypothetical protein [Actinomycetota bacterium]
GVLVLTFGLVAPAGAQEDVPDQCRTIIGCPDAGPEPEHSGDRGGWAQLLTLAVMAVAVGVVLVRIVRVARRADRLST